MSIDFITMDNIVDHIIDIIIDDAKGADIETHLQEKYTKSLHIYDNPEAYDMPGENEAPFMCIFRDEHSMGNAQDEWMYRIDVEVAVNDDSKDTTNSRVTKYLGVRNLATLVYLIYKALSDYLPCNADIDACNFEVDETQHPLYIGYVTFIIKIPQVIGARIGLPNLT